MPKKSNKNKGNLKSIYDYDDDYSDYDFYDSSNDSSEDYESGIWREETLETKQKDMMKNIKDGPTATDSKGKAIDELSFSEESLSGKANILLETTTIISTGMKSTKPATNNTNVPNPTIQRCNYYIKSPPPLSLTNVPKPTMHRCICYIKSPLPFTLSTDIIFHIARYLDLRSIQSLSCINTFYNDTLSSDFLYCHSRNNDSILPCLQTSSNHLPFDERRKKGVARKFAIESHMFSTSRVERTTWSDYKNARSFYLEDHHHDEDMVDYNLVSTKSLVYTTKSSHIIIRHLKTKQSITYDIPRGENLLCSAFSDRGDLCATLVARSCSSRNEPSYLIHVVKIPSSLENGLIKAPIALWQHEINDIQSQSSTSWVAFFRFSSDGRKLLFGGRHVMLFDSFVGTVLWSIDESFETGILHNELVIGTQRGCINIYDTRRQQNDRDDVFNSSSSSLVGCGTFDKCLNVAAIKVFGGRLLIEAHPLLMRSTPYRHLLCTNRIMRHMRKRRSEPSVDHEQQQKCDSFQFHAHSLFKNVSAWTCYGDHLFTCRNKAMLCYNKSDLSKPVMMYQMGDCGDVNYIHVGDTKITFVTSSLVHILPFDSVTMKGFVPPVSFLRYTFPDGCNPFRRSEFKNSKYRILDIQIRGPLIAMSMSPCQHLLRDHDSLPHPLIITFNIHREDNRRIHLLSGPYYEAVIIIPPSYYPLWSRFTYNQSYKKQERNQNDTQSTKEPESPPSPLQQQQKEIVEGRKEEKRIRTREATAKKKRLTKMIARERISKSLF